MTSAPRISDKELVGPYRIVRAIGAGGSARIDLAVVERAYGFQRHVVLKRPLEHLRADAHVATTLRREAELGGRLRHPNLVAVLDAGTHDGYDYLALEYVEGASLRSVMQPDAHAQPARVRVLPLQAALSIVAGVARGLHEAHELAGADGAPLGLVHRDVSPGNILVDRDGSVKLADFGIAKDTRVTTLSGSMRGTVTYMAPEQCRGHAFDRRADVFSLGVILHELITGHRLFWAENDVASLHKVLSGPLPDPRELAPSVPPELAALAMRTIAREPGNRIASAHELAERIEAFAARSGLVLGARTVAPILAAPTTRSARMTAVSVSVPSIDEPSLVAVIEAMVDDAEIEPSFGPTDNEDDLATPVRKPTQDELAPLVVQRANRSRAVLVVALACAAIGIAIGALFAMRGEPTTTAPAVAPAARPDAAPAAVVDIQNDAGPEPSVASEPTAESSDAGVASPRTRKQRGTKVDTSVAPPEPPTPPAEPVDASVDAPAVGSGAKPNVEWNPHMLLPDEQGSATTKR